MSNHIVPSAIAILQERAAEWDAHLQRLVAANELSMKTRQTYNAALDRFIRWIAANPQSTMQTVGIDYKVYLSPNSPFSVNVWITGVRAFFNWAVEVGHFANNPFAKIKGIKRAGTSQKHFKQPLTDDEVRRVLAIIDTTKPEGVRDLAIISLMLYCGLRTVEINRSNYEYLRTDKNQLVFDVQGKGRFSADDYVVIANQHAITNLMAWIAVRGRASGALFTSYSDRSKGARLTTDSIRHMVKRYILLAGVVGAKKSTHSLRHTAITKAIQNGAKPQKVQSMARHANISTTMIYYHEFDRVTDPAEAYIDYE